MRVVGSRRRRNHPRRSRHRPRRLRSRTSRRSVCSTSSRRASSPPAGSRGRYDLCCRRRPLATARSPPPSTYATTPSRAARSLTPTFGVSAPVREVELTDRSDTEPGSAGGRAGAFAQIARAADDDTSAATVAPGRAARAADAPTRRLPLEEVAEAFGIDTGRLAALVNEALQEQARRHGVDLS